MNPFTGLFDRDGRNKLVLTALCALLLCGPSAFGADPGAGSNRFLFIIDTSASMKPFENAVRESMFDLIYSGVRGRMTNGDTYGIWLISGENDMSFKMETWRKRHIVEMAARAATHVKDHGFKGKPNLSQAFSDAGSVIKNVNELTVILISNGENPITGTPFDTAINERFLQLAPEMKKAKATLNTTLIARDGQFAAWAANSPEFLIEVPYVAPAPKRPEAAPMVAKKTGEAAPAPVVNAPAPSAPPRPNAARATAPAIIITRDTVAQERREFLAMTSTATNEPVAAPAVTNAAVAAAPAIETNVAATVSATNESKPVTAPTNAIVPQLANVPVHAPTTDAVAVAKPKATNVAAAAPAATPTPPATPTVPATAETISHVAATPATQGVHLMFWAGLGVGATFSCVLAIVFVWRTRRQEPSLISQSLVRESSHWAS